MRGRRFSLQLAAFGLLAAAITAAGIGARATYGARTTADEPQYLLSALSIWEDFELDISDELAEERYREFHEADLPVQTVILEDGRQVSPHDPLLPLLLAVPTGLGGWVGAKVAMALIAGLLAAGLVWTAVERLGVSRGVAFVTTGLFALAAPLAVYSTQIYPEVPAALAVLGAFAALTGPFEKRGLTLFVIAVVALPWLAVKYVPVAAVLGIVGLVRAGKGRRLWLVGWFGLAGAVFIVGHLAIYGGLTPYATGDHFVGGEFTAVGHQVDLWGRSSRLIGLLVDRGFGIATWQPAFLLLPVAAGWAASRRRFVDVTAGAVLATGWLVATFVALTMHGWWFPGRQLVVVLPMAVLLVAMWVDRARFRTAKLIALGSAGVVAFVFLVVEGTMGRLTWVVDFGSTLNPIYQALAWVMPDYMAPGPRTWVLHGLWVTVALGLGWRGWRQARQEGLSLQVEGNETEREKVLT